MRASERGVDLKTRIMLERFEEQTARDPRDADAYAVMGEFWSAKGDFHAAVEHLDKALEIDPNNVDALRYRAVLRTCPESGFRDGEGALCDITRAMDIANANGRLNGDWLHRLYLRIRAAANAELTQYDIAIATEALDLSITKSARDQVKRELAQCESDQKTVF